MEKTVTVAQLSCLGGSLLTHVDVSLRGEARLSLFVEECSIPGGEPRASPFFEERSSPFGEERLSFRCEEN